MVLLFNFHLHAQEVENITEKLENSTLASTEEEQDLTKHIGINNAPSFELNNLTRSILEELQILSPQQIAAFFEYKSKNGPFISIFELQAIPYWDIATIKKIIPVFKQPSVQSSNYKLITHKEVGYQQVIVRMGRSGNGFTSGNAYVKGLKQTILYRNTSIKNYSAGISLEKDAGEKNIFDFTSLYFQRDNLKHLKKIIIGDYLINMGQGLIHWQGYAFGKSTNLLSILKQGQLLKPHTGTEENRFHRGVGMEFNKNNTSITWFFSLKKNDANIVYDSSGNKKSVSSLLLSGLHRDAKEIEDKHSLSVMNSGFILKHSFRNGHIALNGIHTSLSIPLQKRDQPYNLYSIKGKKWNNVGIDYAFSNRYGTFFGELALDNTFSKGTVLGYLKSLHRNIDFGIQWRSISKSYNAISSNTIAHHSSAGNEKGLYLGLNIIVNRQFRIEGYTDRFIHPFPVYGADGIQRGWVNALVAYWTISKKSTLYARFIEKYKNQNFKNEGDKSNSLNINYSKQLRVHGNFKLNDAIELRIRNEFLISKTDAVSISSGWLGFVECIVQPPLQPYSISYRTTYFHTDGYSSGLYAIERDLPHYYSMNVYYNKGNSSYLLLNYMYNKQISFACKWSIDKKYFPSTNLISDFFVGISNDWRFQLTIKF